LAVVAAASVGTIAISRFERAEGAAQASPLQSIGYYSRHGALCFPAILSCLRRVEDQMQSLNRGKTQSTLVDPRSCISHVRPYRFWSSASAIPHNLVLEPSTMLSQHGVLAKTPFEMLGYSVPSLKLAWPVLRRLSFWGETLISPSLSMLAALLIPVAVLAGALGVWRLAADPGWTSQFFLASGLLSHWQVWITVAILTRTSSRGLSKWLEKQQ
jgi:hypothetical protein